MCSTRYFGGNRIPASKKITIIGGSISGLATALELLKLGEKDVLVLEKKNEPDCICGGAISSFAMQEAQITIPKHVVAATIKGTRIYGPNLKYWEIRSKNHQNYGYVLYRSRFEAYLMDKIIELGGKIDLGHEVVWVKPVPSETYVAADGLTGVCRRTLGLAMPSSEDVHIGMQIEARLEDYHNFGLLELFFGEEYAPKGYAWIFPLYPSVDVYRIGLGIPLSIKKNSRKLLQKFLNFLHAEPCGPIRGKLIPTALPNKPLVVRNVLLTGDAGLLCDPATGGGIANGYMSGKFAARAIHENHLRNYERYCAGIKRRNHFRYNLKKILYDLSDEDYNDLIDGMQNFHPKLVRVSWALAMALMKLTIKKPKLMMKHKILRRVAS
jgi:digeranylgeranylglycerophospholipid reductase